MRSRAVLALLAACVAGALALALVGAADERTVTFTTNVRVVEPVIAALPGEEACQNGVQAGATFDTVELFLSTGAEPGPPVAVTVWGSVNGRALARGLLPAGTRDNQAAAVRLTRPVAEGELIDVCLRDAGTRDVGFYGGPSHESPGHSFVNGRPGTGDIRIGFLRSEPRSALALVPDMFERATRFRPEPVGAWTFWVLLAAVAAGIPLLLAAALRRATRA